MQDNLRLSMDSIPESEIIKEFDNSQEIWPESDKWHRVCKENIPVSFGDFPILYRPPIAF
jgi:hypothetical protein